jgi:hypothetical protein
MSSTTSRCPTACAIFVVAGREHEHEHEHEYEDEHTSTSRTGLDQVDRIQLLLPI